jgi:hypothetical protein
VLIAATVVGVLALGSQRIVAEQASFHLGAAGRCVPAALNGSAVLPGTTLAVSPLPNSYDASPATQISLLGAPRGTLDSVVARGSETGAHAGRLIAYSQGDGASFVPAKPFRSGEVVTVSGKLTAADSSSAAHAFGFRFVVARQDSLKYVPPGRPPKAHPGVLQRFASRTDLQPPAVVVTTSSPNAAPGYVFAAPYSGPGPSGPMIFDQSGNLVWFDPLPFGTAATNLQVQEEGGKPVLTWWQGYIPPQGFGEGEEVITDASYRQLGRVHAGNGHKMDLHDFHLMPNGTAVTTVFDPIDCDLSSVGGPHDGAVTDGVIQEIDLKTGLVRSEWHALDHVGLGDSHSSPAKASAEWPFDYFHVNSIVRLADGTTLISARNTWALYELSTQTGQIQTRIGGPHSDVKLAAGAETAFQHDAEALPNGTISIFDNGGVPNVHRQSRGMIVSLDPDAKTDTVLAQYEHPTALSSGSQGNMQSLTNGDFFVGWGSEPYFSEFAGTGQLLFDAHLHGPYQSYRAYRFPWTGAPGGRPAIAARTASASSPVTVYASWNGDTQTASWRVLAGASTKGLAPVAGATRAGFETAVATPGPERYVAVQALDASGAVLGVSPTIKG